MLLDLRPSNVRFGYDPARGFNLGLVRPAAWRGDTGALRDCWAEVVVGSHLRPMIGAVGAGFCGDCALLPAAGRRGTRCR
jgi:hypothetical protein